ncbi:hypothetical protein CARUB_v10001531mg [Capsella rubella]|uniref:Protein kinase domain-containing protein n=1 Tax=Capsella rubella TaxID=81985 RepID=R0FGS9_9BRAS|nr:probable receptor-like protein kinase At1g49730 [Capsella rubella]EOA21186.1 hypothetical protein CARUB_v10001531mg [Capsella rubella]
MDDHRLRFSRRIRFLLLAWLRRSRSGRIEFIRRFGYKEIIKATEGFRKVIYSNYHGSAYRAKFKGGEVALVKELNALDLGRERFDEEVQLLGRLRHRHLLTLRGFCIGRKRLLVFDNIENGSLKEHLNDPLKTPLNWKTRIQIAIGVAAALEYLLIFSSNDAQIYDVSVNSCNIMLDENFTPKISDIRVNRHPKNHPKATHDSCSEGSCADEECGNVIFQLGVLMLELITGQSSDRQGNDLIEWVQDSCIANSIDKMIDPDLGNNYSSRELQKVLAVARLCIKTRYEPPSFSITHVYRYLQKKIDVAA